MRNSRPFFVVLLYNFCMMNTLHSEYNFHGIGEGLFVTGLIEKNGQRFRYVYDCGSHNKKPLNDGIQQFKTQLQDGEKINLLVISHLHKDHFNGIFNLLKDKHIRVGLLVMPYLYEFIINESIIDYVVDYDEDDDIKEYRKFINSPEHWLFEHGVDTILESRFMRHVHTRDEDTESEMIAKELQDQSGLIINPNTTKLYYKDSNTGKNKVIFTCDQIKANLRIDRSIHIDFMNLKLKRNGFRYKKTITEFAKKHNLISLIKQVDGINQIKKYLQQSGISTNGKFINRTSVVMGIRNETNTSFPAIVLTGDIEIQDNEKKLLNEFVENHLKTTSTTKLTILYPHHGAYSKPTLETLSHFAKYHVLYVISYGKINSYKHPSAEVVNTLNDNLLHVYDFHSF